MSDALRLFDKITGLNTSKNFSSAGETDLFAGIPEENGASPSGRDTAAPKEWRPREIKPKRFIQLKDITGICGLQTIETKGSPDVVLAVQIKIKGVEDFWQLRVRSSSICVGIPTRDDARRERDRILLRVRHGDPVWLQTADNAVPPQGNWQQINLRREFNWTPDLPKTFRVKARRVKK